MLKFICKVCGSNFMVTDIVGDTTDIVCKGCGAVYERKGLVARLKNARILGISEQEYAIVGLTRFQ